jgi:hypothetical protein
MRTQLWTPDTCNCKIEEVEESPDHWVGGNVIRKCADHTDVPDDELYGVLYSNDDGENKMKNQLEGYLLGMGGVDFGFHEAKKHKDGSSAGTGWKDGFRYKWHFSGTGKNRTLHASVEGGILDNAQKKKIRDACSKRFKSDRVVL